MMLAMMVAALGFSACSSSNDDDDFGSGSSKGEKTLIVDGESFYDFNSTAEQTKRNGMYLNINASTEPNYILQGHMLTVRISPSKVSELKEGFEGNKFGIFNHVSEIIFNFGIINIDLGGILYPKNFFKNVLFYDHNLFLKSTMNSEDFWQSAFIIMENRILRQSSKIFDFTNYLLEGFNYQEYNSNKKKILARSKILLLAQFQNFNDDIKKRQSKIIVSFASYPERFIYLPDLMKFIKNQSFPINKIVLSFYKEHKKFYNLNISDINIIYAEKNLKPHLKYYFTMQLFRDYAIITLDDDLGYSYDTFESLFKFLHFW
jgi:hypothetical protein